MSSGLDWDRFGVITGGDEVCILPPPTLSEKGVGIRTFVHFPLIFVPCDHGLDFDIMSLLLSMRMYLLRYTCVWFADAI